MDVVRRCSTRGDRVIARALADLETALRQAGVGPRTTRRLLDEAYDHLLEASAARGEDAAIAAFGDVRALARDVAAGLATARTRRAAYGGFAALAATGLAYLYVMSLTPGGGWPDMFSARHEAVGVTATLAIFFLPQIAFVAGSLALVRALRLRRLPVVSDAELRVARRRTAVALGAGALTIAWLAVYAFEFGSELGPGWVTTAYALAASLAVPLGAAALATARSAAPTAARGGPAGDVFDDLGVLVDRAHGIRRLDLRRHPWRFALLVATVVGIVGLVVGWQAEGTLGDGVVRGALEALALLGCFAALGKVLALRR